MSNTYGLGSVILLWRIGRVSELLQGLFYLTKLIMSENTKNRKSKPNLVQDYGLLNVHEAAEYLNVSLSTFRIRIAPALKHVAIPTREHYFTLQQLREYVEQRLNETIDNPEANVPLVGDASSSTLTQGHPGGPF